MQDTPDKQKEPFGPAPLPTLIGTPSPVVSKFVAKRALAVSVLWAVAPVVSALLMTKLHVSRSSGVPGIYAFQFAMSIMSVAWEIYAFTLALRSRTLTAGRVALIVSAVAGVLYTVFAVAGVVLLYQSYQSLWR